MVTKKVKLKGLRGNYQQNYTSGDVVYRKYKKEWHIYVEATNPYNYTRAGAVPITAMSRNSIQYVNSNPDLQEALKRAGKPLTTINDKSDNLRLSLSQIEIEYNATNGMIVGHKILASETEEIATHKEILKEKKEIYEKLPTFGAFMSVVGEYKLTYELSKQKN